MDRYVNGRICGGTNAIYCASQTLRAESPLLRVNGQENSSPAEAGLAALGRAPGLFLCLNESRSRAYLLARARAWAAIARANVWEVSGAVTMNRDGSVSSSSMIIGRPSAPGTMSTRA